MKRLLAFAVLLASPSLAATVGAPTGVELTVYNQNFALVKEVRTMDLDSGINTVPVQDVAATIEATSVAFKSTTGTVTVLEQNYRYDLISPQTILSKSVGKPVKIRRYTEAGVQELEGILMSTPENGVVVRTGSGVILNPGGEIEVSEMPEGLLSRPTLVWKLYSEKAGPHRTEISYLANQLTWQADYVAVIDPLDKYVDIVGWVTLVNNSGADFTDAKLNLMAGDVHRVQEPRGPAGPEGLLAYAGKTSSQFTEKSLFEYHLYTMKDPATVKNKETKQITLLSADRVPIEKEYIYDGRKDRWYYGYIPGEGYDTNTNKKVNVFVKFTNSQANNLGLPLPKGRVRVYKSELDANRQFIGEDQIDHTPKDETVRLYLGDAFDVVGEHSRTNFRRVSQNEVEETFQIKLRNHKSESVRVKVVEHLSSDWRITDSSHKYFKKDASTVEIPVDLAKDGEAVITYTVRTKY
ncbi:MAG: DUF4139 domain-containing protein [Armatimonadota bacterium]